MLYLFEIITEIILEEHVAFDVRFIEVFVVGTYAVVCQMDEFIVYLFGIVVDC